MAVERDSLQVRYLEDLGRLSEGLRLGAVGVWRWKIDSDLLEWTANLEAIHRLPQGSFDGTLSSFIKDVHPDYADAVWVRIKEAIAKRTPYRCVYRTSIAAGDGPLWIEASGGLVTAADGATYLTGVCQDVTERVMRERELERRLRQQQAIGAFGAQAFGAKTLGTVMDQAVRIAAGVLEVPLAKILKFGESADKLKLVAGVGWKEGLVGTATVGVDLDSQAGFTLQSQEPVIVRDLRTETRFTGPALLHDHGVRSGLSVVIAGSDQRPFGVFGLHARELRTFDSADVDFLLAMANIVANSARHFRHQESQNLLLREMAHRSGNLLQIVASIASQTFAAGRDTAEAAQKFGDQLASLARANHLVAQDGWTTTRFSELARETLMPFGERIRFIGRDILLPADLSFDLSLVLHELATNAAKYGSFARNGSGQVRVSWNVDRLIDHDVFHFEWHDPSDGPVMPLRHGFGSRLLTAIIEKKWQGTSGTTTEEGYTFSLDIPLPGHNPAIPL